MLPEDGMRRAWQWARTREGIAFSVLVLVSIIIRLVLAPYHGFFNDVATQISWGRAFDHNPIGYYGPSISIYPPLAGYVFGVMVATCDGFCRAAPPLDMATGIALWMKLPTLIADLVTIGLIYAVARKSVSIRAALIAAASYALAPAVLFDGALWGQSDALSTLFIVVALLCALRGQVCASGVAMAVALLFKPQPMIFVPLILVYVVRWFGWRPAARWATALCLTGLVVSAPYLLPPHPEILTFLHNVHKSLGQAPFASVDALNLWWFLGLQHLSYHEPLFGPLSATLLGDAVFALIAVIALVGVWLDRSAGHLFAAAGTLATGFFVLTTLQRERYLFPAIVLFLLAAIYDRRYVRYYVVASITAFLAMLAAVVLEYTGSRSGFDLAPAGHWLSAHSAYLVVVAGVAAWLLASVTTNLALASWKTWRAQRELPPQRLVSRERAEPVAIRPDQPEQQAVAQRRV